MLDAAIGIAVLLYAGIAAATWRRGRDEGLAPARALTFVLGNLALLGASTIADRVLEVPSPLALGVLIATLAAHPSLLLFLVRTMTPVSRREWLALATLAAALTLVVVSAFSGLLELDAAVVRSLVAAFTIVWVSMHLLAARTLRRAARAVPGVVARWRGGAAAAAAVLLGTVMVVPIALGIMMPTDVATAITLLLGYLAAALLWFGVVPPRWARYALQRKDRDDLAAAELVMLRGGADGDGEREYLQAVARAVAAEAVWLVADGQVVLTEGVTTIGATRLSAGLASATSLIHREAVDGQHLTAARAGRGWLCVVTGTNPLMFGAIDPTMLETLARRMQLVLDAAATERRGLEAERAMRNARHLADIMRLKDDVLSTLSHELQTPLVSIVGMSELLNTRWCEMEDESRRELVQRIHVNGARLRHVVADAIDAAAIKARTVQLSIGTATVRDVVDGVECTLSAMDRSRLVTGGDLDVSLTTDAGALTRAVAQVVDNALKFSPFDTLVRLDVTRTGDVIEFRIDDAGRGMSAEAIADATEPFYRAGDVLTRDTRGLGLGLTLATKLLDRLDGSMELAANPAGGTRAIVRVPA